MPEQDLDDPDIGSVLEKMRREAVAQRVERDALGEVRISVMVSGNFTRW